VKGTKLSQNWNMMMMMMRVRAWRERGCRDAVCSCPVTQDAASSADRPLQLHSNCPAQAMHRGSVPASQDSKAHGQDMSICRFRLPQPKNSDQISPSLLLSGNEF
jgi:hypothetical protein